MKFERIRNGTAHDWYRIANQVGDSADVLIYDEISAWGVMADQFVRDVSALDVATINLKLNTPGGLVFDGIAIHNALRDHKAKVHVTVDGLAASIGSVIAMAGDTVTMNRGTHMMIHDAAGLCVGNAKDMGEMVELLDKLSGTIAGFYAARAGGTPQEWRDRMLTETWFTAQEAVDAGLADRLAGSEDTASTNSSAASNRARLVVARHRARTHGKGVQ